MHINLVLCPFLVTFLFYKSKTKSTVEKHTLIVLYCTLVEVRVVEWWKTSIQNKKSPLVLCKFADWISGISSTLQVHLQKEQRNSLGVCKMFLACPHIWGKWKWFFISLLKMLHGFLVSYLIIMSDDIGIVYNYTNHSYILHSFPFSRAVPRYNPVSASFIRTY